MYGASGRVVNKSSRLWRAAAVVFAVINVGGAIYAAMVGEWMHAVVHIALLGGGYMAWQLIPGRGETDTGEAQPAETRPAETRIESIQESVDAIALNVERIGEAQRFQEKILRERAAQSTKRGVTGESEKAPP